MTSLISVAATSIVCFALTYGALCDMTRFRIPNAVSYGLALLFAAAAPFLLEMGDMARSILVFVVIFGSSIVFWKLRWLGGGDVKFLSSTSLWVGADLAAPFLILLVLYSAALVAVLRFARRWNDYIQASQWPVFAKVMVEKAKGNVVPYGLPIALAGLSTILYRLA